LVWPAATGGQSSSGFFDQRARLAEGEKPVTA
jgi:hypothetical protein